MCNIICISAYIDIKISSEASNLLPHTLPSISTSDRSQGRSETFFYLNVKYATIYSLNRSPKTAEGMGLHLIRKDEASQSYKPILHKNKCISDFSVLTVFRDFILYEVKNKVKKLPTCIIQRCK